VQSEGFWRLCITLRITGVVAFSVVQNSKELENTKFRNWMCFASSERGRKTPTVLGPLEAANLSYWTKGPNTVGFSLPSPHDGNRSRFRNIHTPVYIHTCMHAYIHTYIIILRSIIFSVFSVGAHVWELLKCLYNCTFAVVHNFPAMRLKPSIEKTRMFYKIETW
jgi:hypothetical protein